jgi:hypothetical protein
VAYESLLSQAKELERQIGSILSAYDITELPIRERELASALKHQLIDARLGTQEYEYAQTREQQVRAAKEAKGHLEELRKTIVKASEYNLFGAVDVALASARIEQIISRLE